MHTCFSLAWTGGCSRAVRDTHAGSPAIMGVPIEIVAVCLMYSTGGCSAPLLSEWRSVRWRLELHFGLGAGIPRHSAPARPQPPKVPGRKPLGIIGDDEVRNALGWKQSREKCPLWCSAGNTEEPVLTYRRMATFPHRSFYIRTTPPNG